jgi:hypothetical protein
MNTPVNDAQIWELARKRAGFKKNLVSYAFTNLAMIALWLFTAGGHAYFWPFWGILGWGFQLAMQYASCYHGNDLHGAQAEYDHLKKQEVS